MSLFEIAMRLQKCLYFFAMQTPYPIKLVIQGGGAKLSAILAALEGLIEQRDLKVTHICGTSAGAVAGCLYAAGANPGDVRAYFLEHRGEFVEAYRLPSLSSAAFKLAKDASKPFWQETLFRSMLNHFLGNEFVVFSDFQNKRGIVVEVVSVNIVNGATNYHSGDANIIDSVLASSGLPYLFRMASPVDGGLCENLPVERLLARDGPGKVIAISFVRDEPTLPGGILDFSLALVNTVINNSVQRSKALLPNHAVLEIKTEISTFDFATALNPAVGLGKDYTNVREQARLFFNDYVTAERRRVWDAEPHWETTNPSAIAVMESAYQVYRILQRVEPIETRKITFEVTANSLFEREHPKRGYDVVRFILEFEIRSRISCLGVSIIAPPGTAYLNLSDWRVELDNSVARRKAEMVAIPMRDPEAPNARRIGFFFEPLTQQGRYKFIFEDMGNNLMKDLVETGKDRVAFTTWSEGGATDIMDLVLHVPDASPYNRLKVECATGAKQLTELGSEHRSPLGCFTYACRATNVPAGKRVFFNLS